MDAFRSRKSKQVWDLAKLEIESNFVSFVSLLTAAMPKLKDQGSVQLG